MLGANPDYSVFQYGISSSPLHTEYNVISCMQPIRGISSAGRAVALQAIGQRFDPVILHHSIRTIISAVEEFPYKERVGSSNLSSSTTQYNSAEPEQGAWA